MKRKTTILLAMTAALLALLALPSAGSAAKRKVPFGFLGTVLPPEMHNPSQVPDATLDQQMALMASSGVESLRIVLSWDDLEPNQGNYRFTTMDRLIAATARHGISVLGSVTQSARWISSKPLDDFVIFPPRDPAPYAELMRQMVLRYGPNGAFWRENPAVPKVPVRQWQLWNEQSAFWFWRQRRWAPSYVQLLKQSYRAIREEDPTAKVVAGSLVAARKPPWEAMAQMYRAGAQGFFDEVAVHPYTNHRSVKTTVEQVMEIVRRVRAQMRRRGDGRKPIHLTEVTWTAATGRVPKRAEIGFETTPRGQAQRLKAAFSRFARERRKLAIGQIYWYNWASQYDPVGPTTIMSFRYSGLTRLRDGVFSALPILRTYAAFAARYQGCRKSPNARICR